MQRMPFEDALKYEDTDGYTTIYGLATPGGKIEYIGRTVALVSRLWRHIRLIDDSPKKNKWLASMLDRGLKPDVVILEIIPTDKWPKAERQWIAAFGGTDALQNSTEGGDSWCVKVGTKLSKEHKRKIGEANRGRKHTKETRRRMSEARKGYSPTAETRRKLSEAGKGRPVSEATRQKLIEARHRRPAVVPEANTPEARQKRRESAKRRWSELKSQGKSWRPNDKIDLEKARMIRKRYASGNVMIKTLAAEYGVTHSVISNIVHNKTWKESDPAVGQS